MITTTVSVCEIVSGSSESDNRRSLNTRRRTGSAPSSEKGILPSAMIGNTRSSISSAHTFAPRSAREMASGSPTCPKPPTMTTSYFTATSRKLLADEPQRVVDDGVEVMSRRPPQGLSGLVRDSDAKSDVSGWNGHLPESGKLKIGVDARPDRLRQLVHPEGVVAADVEVV